MPFAEERIRFNEMTFRTSCFALTLSLSTVGLLAACGAELQAPDATPDNDGLSATGGMVGSGGGDA